jgi:hypothetical protein
MRDLQDSVRWNKGFSGMLTSGPKKKGEMLENEDA